jgi:glycosyltransferase involved in cell wall biosynthesis
MPVISVLTPAYDPVAEYLEAAYESVVSQELPDGWSLEWVVQQDGTRGRRASDLLPADPLVQLGGGSKGGVSITRNLALARSTGELVKNLDADDVLTPGVLARDIDALTSNPDVHWATSAALDLLPDGSTAAFDTDPPAGRVEQGDIATYWRDHHYLLPVHPTTLCIRRSLAVALGGWMAIPASEDTGLLIAASVVSVGYFHREPGLLYRKWPGQATAAAEHTEPTERNTRMKLISDRADVLSALRWSAGRSALSCRTGC